MKIILLTVVITLTGLGYPHAGFGQNVLPERETYQQKTVDHKTGLPRSRLTGNFKRISDNRYVLHKSGEGNYSRFRDIRWNLESETELRDGLLCPLYTTMVIRNRENRKVYSYKKDYDYAKKIIRHTHYGENDEIIKEDTFSLEGPTTDDATLIHFLRPFMNDLMDGKTIRFNFVSSEPGLYKLKARILKQDTLKVGPQRLDTIKIAITPDMGIFNRIVDKFLPPTLLWYAKDGPHSWLKYEGLECGRGSVHIITTVENIVPSI